MAHFGPRAFDSISGEVVQTTATIIKNKFISDYKPVFFRLLEGQEKEKCEILIQGNYRDQIINKLEEMGHRKIIEIGPSKILSGLINRISKNFDIVSINQVADLKNGSK